MAADTTKGSQSLADVYESIKGAVVTVETPDGNGSGFAFGKTAYLPQTSMSLLVMLRFASVSLTEMIQKYFKMLILRVVSPSRMGNNWQ